MTESNESRSRRRSADDLYAVLSNIRRRYVVYYAKRVGLPILFDEVVEQIATWENPDGAGDVTRRQRKSVHNALRQTHLPKLEAAGLITHDTETDIITLTDEAERVKLYPASETSIWGVGYSLLSVAIVLFVGLDRIGAVVVTPRVGFPWVEALLLTCVLLTIGYNYDRFRRRRRFRSSGPDIMVDEIETQSPTRP